VRLVRAHLEEDAGKSLHEDFIGQTGIDLNRAGTPLLEIVTEPDMRSSAEAVAYAKELHKIVTWIGICDGNMQEGSFRCDANVSVRKPGAAAGHAPRDQEPEQLQVHAAGDRLRGPLADRADRRRPRHPAGHRAVQPRHRRDPRHAHQGRRADYRYFPDPDLPPLVIAPEWVGARAREMPELPRVMAERFVRDYGLPEYDATTADAEQSHGGLLRGRSQGLRPAQAGQQLDHGRGVTPLNAETGHRGRPGQRRAAGRADRRIADGTISNNAAARCSRRCGRAKGRRSTPSSRPRA
jgi:aspartyl-tRNA(Asn)/glutamyl-tRNA(Gln) amidotransferase subunit B